MLKTFLQFMLFGGLLLAGCSKDNSRSTTRLISSAESAPVVTGDGIQINCGGGGGFFDCVAANTGFFITTPFSGKHFLGKPKESVRVNIQPYNCGSNKRHTEKGYKEYRSQYITVTKRYEKNYESGKREYYTESNVLWSSVVSRSKNCVYE